MKSAWLDVLRCPLCREGFHLDATRRGGDDVVEALLLCRACLSAWPVLGGSAILPADLGAHLRAQGGVYRRVPVADPRVTRFVLAGLGSGSDRVPFEEVSAHYGDLVDDPRGARPPDPRDAALAALLGGLAAAPRRALDLGTGVGRGAFLLAAHGAQALGVDRSAARVRRARNLAVTEEPFYVGAPDDPHREVALDLARLARAGVDFAVADPRRLPCADGAFDLLVDHGGDGLGPWPDAPAVAVEVRRVLAPGGLLAEADAGPPAGRVRARHAGWRLCEAA